MATILPFAAPDPLKPDPFFEFDVTIANVQYTFNVRWNGRDGAWYFDVFEEAGTPIVHGVKIVLGCYLGRYVNHPLFREGIVVATDLSGAGRDATLDDLGTRIVVVHIPLDEVLAMRQTVTYASEFLP